MAKKRLTKEMFSSLFSDDFKLTNQAIAIAQEQIREGNEDLNLTEMLEMMVKKTKETADLPTQENDS